MHRSLREWREFNIWLDRQWFIFEMNLSRQSIALILATRLTTTRRKYTLTVYYKLKLVKKQVVVHFRTDDVNNFDPVVVVQCKCMYTSYVL